MSDNIDTLLDELSSFSFPTNTTQKPARSARDINEDNINEYIIKVHSEIIDTGAAAIEDLKDFIVQGQNPDEISALSELINSATKALEHLNKINLQNKKAATDKELKTMDIASRKEVASLLPDKNVVNNTNILVASREEIFKKLLSDISEPEVIDVQVLKDPPKED
jgi:hypothetical protein